jgi:hypothetical protein
MIKADFVAVDFRLQLAGKPPFGIEFHARGMGIGGGRGSGGLHGTVGDSVRLTLPRAGIEGGKLWVPLRPIRYHRPIRLALLGADFHDQFAA